MENRQLNPFISLKDTGELRVHSDILTNLTKQLCKIANKTDLDEALRKVKKTSKVKLKTRSGYLEEVFSVPKSVVKIWTRSLSLVSVPGLYSDLDLERGKYEGGFKVWESTADLVKFITEDQTFINELLRRPRSLKTLELGAGASLPSLALLGRLIEDPDCLSDYRIHVQDYNWQVLASLTLMNFAVNLPLDYLKALIDTRSLRFFYGDWKDFKSRSSYKYDLIMMSEVIYNSDNYYALHNLLEKHLRRNGYIVIATKNTYFGLTGGLQLWLDYAAIRDVFCACKIIKVTSFNIPRSILIMKRVISENM